MAATADAPISERILEVLIKIDEKLEKVDRQLQVGQPREQSRARAPRVQQVQYDIEYDEREKEKLLSLNYEDLLDAGFWVKLAGGEPTEVTIAETELEQLLAGQLCPCPHVPEIERKWRSTKHEYPFRQLTTACLIADIYDSGESCDCSSARLRALFSKVPHPSSLPLVSRIQDCLSCPDYGGDAENPRTTVWYRKFLERGESGSNKAARFGEMPSVLTPGALLMSRGHPGTEQYAVVSACEIVPSGAGLNVCRVDYWHYNWTNSGRVGICASFDIQQYSGTQHFSQLPWRPVVDYVGPETDDLLAKALDRGKERLSVLQSFLPGEESDYYPMLFYDGSLTDQDHGAKHGYMVIDSEAYRDNVEGHGTPEKQLKSSFRQCVWSVKLPAETESAWDTLLLPTHVEGYHVNSGQWLRVPLSGLRPIKWTQDAFDSIVLPKGTKQMLMAETTSFFDWRRRHKKPEDRNRNVERARDMDMLTGKRRGLVYHFHGSPGTGKTLLATALAEACQRPLLSIRPDLIATPAEFSTVLQHNIWLSSRWDAILKIDNADDLLQVPHGDNTSKPYTSVLLKALDQFQGVMILTTSRLPDVEGPIKGYIKDTVLMPSLTNAGRRQIFSTSLRKVAATATIPQGGRDKDFLRWFEEVIEDWQPAGHEVRNTVMDAAKQASADGRAMALSDLISSYTAKTGNRNDWDTVSSGNDSTLVYDGVATSEGAQTSPKGLIDQVLSLVPDDGRLPLHSAETLLGSFGVRPDTSLCKAVSEAVECLGISADVSIIDWGWPKGRWKRQAGCVHKLRTSESMRNRRAADQWQDHEFTFGLRRVLQQGSVHRVGKPWRRLLLCQGFLEIPRSCASIPDFMQLHHDPLSTPLVQEVYAAIGHQVSIGGEIRIPATRVNSPSWSAKSTPNFHLVFYEFTREIRGLDSQPTIQSENTIPFFGRQRNDDRYYLRKSAFTLASIPSLDNVEVPDPIHWTIVCLTPGEFWESQSCEYSNSPSLRAHLLCYVAKALRAVGSSWHSVLNAVAVHSKEIDILKRPDRLQEILFDDDTFSTSKRYFWLINFIHDVNDLLGKNIEAWADYEKTLLDYVSAARPVETWEHKALEEIEIYRRDASDSFADLKELRKSFQVVLERVTVMRDGLFNASSVMETRESTKLGENVRLLTLVNIFFLPLSLATAIWSTNESYSRQTLAVVAVALTLVTFLVTLNLNNLARVVGRAYSARRQGLIKKMDDDPDDWWGSLGERFRDFERPHRGQVRPSEWMILAFSVREQFARLFGAVRGIFPGQRPPRAISPQAPGFSAAA